MNMESLPPTLAASIVGLPSTAASETTSVSADMLETSQQTRKHPLPNSPKWPLGTKIQKHFSGYGTFIGKVESYDDGLYHIVYSDGDAEDFDENDMEEHLYLVPSASAAAQPPTVVTPPPSIENAMTTPASPRSRKRLKLEAGSATAVATATVTPPQPTATPHSFGALHSKDVPIHTLILGTFPALESFAQREYFARSNNAFWWIAGDCLGFRRNNGERVSGDGDLGLCEHLRFGKEHCVPYQQQVDIFCSKGFALWDVLATCKRKGSLDSSIQKGSDVPNDIRGFVQRNPSIRRIVFASGKSTARYFNIHFKDWWATGELAYSGDHPYSVEMFAKMLFDNRGNDVIPKKDSIVCVVAKSVSPADANATYEEKRQFWEDHVYGPGLEMYFATSRLPTLNQNNDEAEEALLTYFTF